MHNLHQELRQLTKQAQELKQTRLKAAYHSLLNDIYQALVNRANLGFSNATFHIPPTLNLEGITVLELAHYVCIQHPCAITSQGNEIFFRW